MSFVPDREAFEDFPELEDPEPEARHLLIAQPDRLDKALAHLCPDLSRARLQSLIHDGHVTLNGQPTTQASRKTQPGDMLTLYLPPPIAATPQPQNLPLDIVYQDDDLLVINKAAGMVVHPAAGAPDGTLVNALLYHCGNTLSGIGGVLRPGIVHRLDKDTSGLMVVAKHDAAHHHLSAQLADRSLSRHYLALVWGIPKTGKGRVETQIGRAPHHRKKMAVLHSGGKTAITDWQVEKTWLGKIAQISCHLQTGRTHQIRVHMTHLGHPLLGDATYGTMTQNRQKSLPESLLDTLQSLPGQALHATEIGFIHPTKGEKMSFSVAPPLELQKVITILERLKEESNA